MSALNALLAPPVIPDHQSDEYQVARRVLDDHPGIDLHHQALSSLAQNLVNTIGRSYRWRIDKLQGDVGRAEEQLADEEAAHAETEAERDELRTKLAAAGSAVAA